MRRAALIAIMVGLLGFVGLRVLVQGRRADPDPLPSTSSPQSQGSSETPTRADLVAIVDACARTPDSLVATGWVRNGLELTVRYVEIMVTWLDPAGLEVEDDFLTVVGAETLMPGDSTAFRLSTTAPGAVGCAAEVFAYDPIF